MSVEAVGLLQEPVRRAVYEYVAGRDEPSGRGEVARALGIGRTLAAFHLDRLAGAGLLEVSYARRSGRTGPGAGRPAKLYRRSAAEHELSLPPRRYLAAAELLAAALEQSGVDAGLFDAARRRGRALGEAREAQPAATDPSGLMSALVAEGYEPVRQGAEIVLRNCPYHRLARDYPPLVCGMNLALIEGLVDGLGCADAVARMAPDPARCCVAIDVASKNNSD
jgi:predicted ArsR family transcriptional regulator